MANIVVSGVLKGPTGKPVPYAELTLRSRATTTDVIGQSEYVTTLASDGSYTLAIQYGSYDIIARFDTQEITLARSVRIDANTSAKTLNQLIVDHQGEEVITPGIILEFRALTAETRGYCDEAKQSAAKAATNANKTAADRTYIDQQKAAIDDQVAYVDSQSIHVDSVTTQVDADKQATAQSRQTAVAAKNTAITARDDAKDWATGEGVVATVDGADRYSARVEADRASDERTMAASARGSAVAAAGTAKTSAEAAEGSAGAAADSQAKAKQWADASPGVEVEPGQYSARHWAEDARRSVIGQLIYRGMWDASSGAYPSGSQTGDFYKVSVAGTVNAEAFGVGDHIIYNGAAWDHIDNTETVVSVGGFSGAITSAQLLEAIKKVDGGGSNLNADQLDGFHWDDLKGMWEAFVKGFGLGAEDSPLLADFNAIPGLPGLYRYDPSTLNVPPEINGAYGFVLSLSFTRDVGQELGAQLVVSVSVGNPRARIWVRSFNWNDGAWYMRELLSDLIRPPGHGMGEGLEVIADPVGPSGICLRAKGNPPNTNDAILTVRSSGGASRLRVEHGGWVSTENFGMRVRTGQDGTGGAVVYHDQILQEQVLGNQGTGETAANYTSHTQGGTTLYMTTHRVTFDTPFKAAPTVVAGQESGNDNGHSSIRRIWAGNVTNQYVDVVVADITSSGGVNISVVAVEKRNNL